MAAAGAGTSAAARPRRAPGDPSNPKGVNSPNRRAERLQQRGEARRVRVDRARADGSRIKSGEGDLTDELDLMYEEGVREGSRRGRRPRRPTAADVDRANRPSPARRSAPAPSRSTSSSSFTMPNIGNGVDRASGKTLILTFVAVSALGAVARDTIHGTPNITTSTGFASFATRGGAPSSGAELASKKSGSSAPPAAKKIPVHLQSLTGVFVVGSIALVLNEVSPALGVSMAGILLLDVGLSLLVPAKSAGKPTATLADYIGASVFNGGKVAAPIPNAKAAPSQPGAKKA